MEKSMQGEQWNIHELFRGEPPRVIMHSSVRRPMCGERSLLTARAIYPEFDFSVEASAHRINIFYAELAARFLDWCSAHGAKYVEHAYESDPDPARRFRHRRYLAYAHFTPGFVSPELISVRGVSALLHGSEQLGCHVMSECWRVRDGSLIPWQKKIKTNETKYISREGNIVKLTAGDTGFSEVCENVEKSIYDFGMISKIFAKIR